jgi:hypothetical protein
MVDAAKRLLVRVGANIYNSGGRLRRRAQTASGGWVTSDMPVTVGYLTIALARAVRWVDPRGNPVDPPRTVVRAILDTADEWPSSLPCDDDL